MSQATAVGRAERAAGRAVAARGGAGPVVALGPENDEALGGDAGLGQQACLRPLPGPLGHAINASEARDRARHDSGHPCKNGE